MSNPYLQRFLEDVAQTTALAASMRAEVEKTEAFLQRYGAGTTPANRPDARVAPDNWPFPTYMGRPIERQAAPARATVDVHQLPDALL